MNISFITSNDFRRLCPFVFVMPTSTVNTIFILVESFSACTFSRIYALFPIQTLYDQTVIHFPFKWKLKQNSSKTKRHSQRKEAKSVRLADEPPSANETYFGALSQGLCDDWLDCIAYCIFWHLIGSDQLSYFS